MVSLINKQIRHIGALGVGMVIEQDNRYITVEFASKTSKFAYPDAFEKFLVPVDKADADAIKKELEEAKAAKVAEAVKRAEEEQTKLKVLKDQAVVSDKRVSSIKIHVPVKKSSRTGDDISCFSGRYVQRRENRAIYLGS